MLVAPVRERGLKSAQAPQSDAYPGRSREGAWIEMAVLIILAWLRFVAPVRERGLKYKWWSKVYHFRPRRSREGAWIEIARILLDAQGGSSRSREGAWIEMHTPAPRLPSCTVAPVRERGLK